MRAALYHRVSTRDQRPELAADELRAAARMRGFTDLVEVFETGSGYDGDRPGLQRVMALAAAGQLAAVVCWKLDRFGRSVVDLTNNIETLRRSGVRFIVTSNSIDIDPVRADPLQMFGLRVLCAAAEMEREFISERTRLAAREAKRRGHRWGRPSALDASTAEFAHQQREAGLSFDQIGDRIRAAGGPSVTRAAVRRAVLGWRAKSGGSKPAGGAS